METLLCARSTIVLAALVAALMGSGTLSAETTPLAVSPGSASGTEIAAACPTFSWSAVSGANGYQIVAYQVAKGTSPSTNPQELKQLWTVTLPGSVHIWTPPVGQCFAHGGRYAWAVRALVGTTPTNWSNANLFSVERAPSAEEVRAAIATLRRYLDAKETITKASVSSASASPRPDATSARTLARPRHNTKEKGKPIRTRQNPLGLKSARGDDVSSLTEATTEPAVGSPSLSVTGNISLGPNSAVTKNGALYLWDDTVGNMALGESALASVTGGNSRLSYQASENTAVGSKALYATYGSSSNALDGSYNTAMGYGALRSNTRAHDNSAFGAEALLENTSGYDNTAAGAGALRASTSGNYNTAEGTFALLHNTSGNVNTAIGAKALELNTTGSGNSAFGTKALLHNTNLDNTGVGFAALYSNTSGQSNTTVGFKGLYYNTSGTENSAIGSLALFANTSGNKNTAVGEATLFRLTTGSKNTAIGYGAGWSVTSGSNNIALGYQAGSALTSGDHDNIMIGHPGYAGDSNVTAIGKTGNQNRIFVAGIYNVTPALSSSAESVVVASNNQLGIVSSSRRFKQDIKAMGKTTDKLYELQPVTFRYKKSVKEAIKEGRDPKKLPLDYGLIAEDVARVYPDLVVYDKKGRPETIKYRFLAPMLLNELEKEHHLTQTQQVQIEYLEREVRSLERQSNR